MKRLQILIISILLMTNFSCKDEIEIPISPNDFFLVEDQINYRIDNKDDCGFIDELCTLCRGVKAAPDEIAHIPELIIYSRSSNGNGSAIQYEVSVQDYFGSSDFLISTPEGDFVLSNSTNSFLRSKSIDMEIPEELMVLFSLNHSKLLSNTYSEEEIEFDLDQEVNFVNGRIEIQPILESNNDGNDVQPLVIYPCDASYYATMHKFFENLNQPNEVFSETTESVWMSNMEFYFDQAAEGIELGRVCVDPRLVVDNMLDAYDNGSWSETQVQNLKLNYLTLLLNLDESEAEILSNAGNDLVDELYGKTKCGAISFCPNENQNDVIEHIVKDLIETNSLSNFSNELSKFDIIDIENLSDNSKLYCIYKQFENAPNNILCDLTQRFFGESPINLKIIQQEFLGDEAKARTGFENVDNKVIRIRFNTNFVDTACNISIMKTLLHELIHAELYAFVKDPSIDPSNFADLYEAYRKKKGWQHEAMADFFRNRIMTALKAIFGNQFTNEQYDALSWQGLDEYEVVEVNGDSYKVPISQAWTNLKEDEKNTIRLLQHNIEQDCDNDGIKNDMDESPDSGC